MEISGKCEFAETKSIFSPGIFEHFVFSSKRIRSRLSRMENTKWKNLIGEQKLKSLVTYRKLESMKHDFMLLGKNLEDNR